MTNQIFVGTSEKGSLEEALSVAIQTAKDGSGPSDFVTWKIVEIFGSNGGFVLENKLSVKIEASAGES